MSSSELVYLFAFGMYVVMFALFLRFFFWKTYSEGKFWNRRPALSLKKVADLAQQKQTELPFFSILVPARNEAEVIEKTVRHMAKLRYDPKRLEIIVVTDVKEQQQNDSNCQDYVLDAMQFLDYALSGDWRGQLKPHVQSLTIGLLSDLCLKQYRDLTWESEHWLMPKSLVQEPISRSRALLYELTCGMLHGNGRISLNRIYRLFRRFYPHLEDTEIERIYPNYLCLAVPIIQLYATWAKDDQGALMRNVIHYSARANHRITQEIVSKLAKMVGQRVQHDIARMQAGTSLKPYLQSLYRFCFPTTQMIVEKVQQEWQGNPAYPRLKHVQVPDDFDGKYRGTRLGHVVPSTKGRALNYALPIAVDERTEMCGFYDAESRPDPDVLLYVAYKRLVEENPVRIFQGPVFQVRNFYEMGPFSKIASLYQALSHDWYLPVVFRRLPFVGGTNLFVEKRLLDDLGGYDSASLTEDLELGTRAYLELGAWPEYLPYPSSEQTPTAFKAFYRQRLRWGTGHLQVMDKIAHDTTYSDSRKRSLMKELFIKGPVEWSFYQFATLVPPTILVLWFLGRVDPNVLPEGVRYLLNVLSLVYISFTFYAFFRYRKHLDITARPLRWPERFAVVAQLLFLPLAAFFFPVPFTSALILKQLKKAPTTWTKTPRSKE
ncbi:MAG: glycosyltransferase family 2 protein [Bacillota bacterium]|jgi:cellulose synthase/poly-beta-1,6-N-acetylglucosamine synthase-like glycosyltransferase